MSTLHTTPRRATAPTLARLHTHRTKRSTTTMTEMTVSESGRMGGRLLMRRATPTAYERRVLGRLLGRNAHLARILGFWCTRTGELPEETVRRARVARWLALGWVVEIWPGFVVVSGAGREAVRP